MTDFEQLQAAFDVVKAHYKENGSDFSLNTVLRDAGFRGSLISQSLVKYGLVKHQPKSLGGGWHVHTTISLQSAILHKAIGKEPQYVRNELYKYLRGLESAAANTDSL